ncbi:MAG: sugar transferase [Muribaculum sp.]|nr:sugar transferase [Muribaculum sp.]
MKGLETSTKLERTGFILTDWITANISVFVFNILRCLMTPGRHDSFAEILEFISQTKLCLEQLLIPLFLLALYWLSGFYNNPFGKSRFYEFLNTALISVISTILIHLALLTNDQMSDIEANLIQFVAIFFIFFIFTFTGRLIVINRQINHFRKCDLKSKTVVVGNSEKAHDLAKRLRESKANIGYDIIGFVRIPGERDSSDIAWNMDEIADVCNNNSVDQIVISPQNSSEDIVLSLVYKLFPLGIPLKLSPATLNFMTSSIQLKDIYGQPLVDLTHSSMSEGGKNVKRTLDVIASAVTLVLLSPLYLALAIWVKLDSDGPVFYRQERIGLHQKPFDIIKFRTMQTDAEATGPQLCDDNDPRVTRCGRIMRKYRLDELPQFWNVLKGDMSIVGPRPEREFFIRQIMKKAPYYTLLYQARPGITSWGMVQYGYASNVDEMVERSKYDLLYISNMSILMDLKIMLYTVLTILEGRGK